MNNDERDQQLYRYPDSNVLRNKLDIRDQKTLDQAERQLVQQRIEEGAPKGYFDLKHLQDIHRHLFQDVYAWAGELRQVRMSKGDSRFMDPERIGLAMQDVHKRVVEQNHMQGLKRGEFAKQAGVIIGDVNLVHPFREGNGRTQLQYLQQLGERAGHKVDLTRFDREEWIKASIEANRAEYGRMQACIEKATVEREQRRNREQELRIRQHDKRRQIEKDQDRER